MQENIAGPLGLSVEAAALGIRRVVNAQMSEGIRLVAVKRGIDHCGFTLVPLGGGGGVHATALARDLSMTRILVPRHPGVLVACGLLGASVEHEVSTNKDHMPLKRAEPLRRATIKDVADASGISIGTISRVMNGHGKVAPREVSMAASSITPQSEVMRPTSSGGDFLRWTNGSENGSCGHSGSNQQGTSSIRRSLPETVSQIAPVRPVSDHFTLTSNVARGIVTARTSWSPC